MTPNGPEPIFSSCSRDPSPCCGQAGTRQWCELKDIAVEDESRPNAWLNNVKRVPSTSYQPESKLPACLLNAIKPPETWRSCKTVLLRCTAGRSGENQASSNKNAKRCRQRWHGTRTRKRTSGGQPRSLSEPPRQPSAPGPDQEEERLEACHSCSNYC